MCLTFVQLIRTWEMSRFVPKWSKLFLEFERWGSKNKNLLNNLLWCFNQEKVGLGRVCIGFWRCLNFSMDVLGSDRRSWKEMTMMLYPILLKLINWQRRIYLRLRGGYTGSFWWRGKRLWKIAVFIHAKVKLSRRKNLWTFLSLTMLFVIFSWKCTSKDFTVSKFWRRKFRIKEIFLNRV